MSRSVCQQDTKTRCAVRSIIEYVTSTPSVRNRPSDPAGCAVLVSPTMQRPLINHNWSYNAYSSRLNRADLNHWTYRGVEHGRTTKLTGSSQGHRAAHADLPNRSLAVLGGNSPGAIVLARCGRASSRPGAGINTRVGISFWILRTDYAHH
jgi:hypothetical protein